MFYMRFSVGTASCVVAVLLHFFIFSGLSLTQFFGGVVKNKRYCTLQCKIDINTFLSFQTRKKGSVKWKIHQNEILRQWRHVGDTCHFWKISKSRKHLLKKATQEGAASNLLVQFTWLSFVILPMYTVFDQQGPAGSRDVPGFFQNPDPGILKNLSPGFFGISRSP